MGCPVHIWGPAAAALVPAARLMRFRLHDRLAAWRSPRTSTGDGSPGVEGPLGASEPPLRRFAPIDPHAPRG
ncbi:MAG: hypothetical protein O3C25_04280 [Chloroflexi bacterium]|nr:hypothetical protein [Chloroflexota bacterium]